MAIQLINLSLWTAQITAQCDLYRSAIWTIEDDDRDISSVETPAAFVYEKNNASEPNELITATSQQMTVTVAVETVLRTQADKSNKHQQVIAQLQRDCRTELLNALVGWISADCITQIEHVNGEQTKRDDKKMIWTDVFKTEFYLRKL